MIRLFDGAFAWSWFSPEKRFNFNGHLLTTEHGVVMVDPPLAITNRNHLRAREEILSRWEVPVVLHEAEIAQAGVPCGWMVEDGDDVYGLKVVHVPGKSPGEIALFWPERRALLVGDALIAPFGKVKTVPEEKMDDPALLRLSLARLKTLDFDALLVGDGDPILAGAKAAAGALLG
jgi:glyoxylase-like metal-dependent hydrolase (beta-lactamase superfamily II)